MGIPHDTEEFNWALRSQEEIEPKVEIFENPTFCPVAPAWVLQSTSAARAKKFLRMSLTNARSMAGSIGASLGPKIDPKVGKTGRNQPKLKISEKVKNSVFV